MATIAPATAVLLFLCISPSVAVLADPAPSLEIEFWDSLAEAFLRYYGKAITLKVLSPNISQIGQSIDSLFVM